MDENKLKIIDQERLNRNFIKFTKVLASRPESTVGTIEEDSDEKKKDFVNNFEIIVLIYTKNNDLIKSDKINYGNIDERKWLGKVSFWAWQNGFYVKTVSAKDYT